MAGFHTKTFTNNDEWMTPKHAWEDIKHFIPKDKVIWEAFYGDGKSGDYLKELGFNVIHEDVDFFENDLGEVIVSNCPFSLVNRIMPRLKELNKPFILIMSTAKINTAPVRQFQQDNPDPIQIIIPRKRIHFTPLVNGKTPDNYKSKCNFECYYYVWKIGLERGVTWLE